MPAAVAAKAHSLGFGNYGAKTRNYFVTAFHITILSQQIPLHTRYIRVQPIETGDSSASLYLSHAGNYHLPWSIPRTFMFKDMPRSLQ